MKLFQIHYADKYGDVCGTLCQLYTNEKAANEAVHWHETHPMPEDMGFSYWVVPLDDDAADAFVPPMTEEAYKELIDECYPDQDEDDYDDYYPEPSEEEFAKYRENEALANELQEQEARLKEERQQTLDAIVDEAIDLCKKILDK